MNNVFLPRQQSKFHSLFPTHEFCVIKTKFKKYQDKHTNSDDKFTVKLFPVMRERFIIGEQNSVGVNCKGV